MANIFNVVGQKLFFKSRVLKPEITKEIAENSST